MSGLEVNKILDSIILAILVVTIIGHIGDIFIDVEHHEMKETAYKIDVPESGDVISKEAPKEEIIEPISLLLANASLEKGEKLSKKCSACHNYEKDSANKVGPNLWNVLNREMGQVEDYKYSKALTAFGGEWNFSSLNKFLLKPKEYIKGTKMNYAGLKKEKDRANILLWLRSLADTPAELPTDDEIQEEIDGLNS